MTTIRDGNLMCLLCGAVHIVDRPIAIQRLTELTTAFGVLHEDCRGENSISFKSVATIIEVDMNSPHRVTT